MAPSVTLMAVSQPMVMSVPYRSLSIVEGMPTTWTPSRLSWYEPVWDPLPPITTTGQDRDLVHR